MTADEYEVSFWGDDNNLKLDYGGGFTVLYRDTSFYCALVSFADTGFFFYKLKVCGNPVSSKFISANFATVLF